jgi:hypothetical protein
MIHPTPPDAEKLCQGVPLFFGKQNSTQKIGRYFVISAENRGGKRLALDSRYGK